MYSKSILITILLITSALAIFPPGPPTILGPVTEGSTVIQVTNLVSTVLGVLVFDADDGDQVVAAGMPMNIRHGTGIVPVIRPLVVGHELTAQQTSAGGTSVTSSKGLLRVDLFKQPGPPTISSLVHSCISAIRVSDVLVGATIKVSVRSVTLGEVTAFDTSDIWIDLNPAIFIFAGDVLQVSQSVSFAGTTLVGTTYTDPLKLYDLFIGNARTKLIIDPLYECQTVINVKGGVPGSFYGMDNKGAISGFHSPSFDFKLYLFEPLKQDLVVFSQRPLPTRCEELPSPPEIFGVASARDPPVPTNSPPPCPNSPSLKFSNLVDGGTLVLTHTDAAGVKTGLEWGNGRGDVILPEGWKLDPSTSTDFFQVDACGHPSSSGKVLLSTDTHPHNLNFLTDLYECSPFVAFTGNPSARTILWWDDAFRSVQLSTPAVPDAIPDTLLIRTPILWEKLTRNRKLFLHQTGCGGAVESVDRPTTKQLPEILNAPFFDQSEVFETSGSVKIGGVLPGALVQVFVDDTPYGQAEAYSDHVTVPLVGPFFPGGIRLRPGQLVIAVQSFDCDSGVPPTSGPTIPPLIVKPAHLALVGNGTKSSILREQQVFSPAE